MTSTGYNTTTTCTLHYDRHPSRVHGVCVTSILSSTISTMHGAITTYKSIATLYLISRTSWDRSTVVCDQKYELSCLLLSRHDNDSSALSECTKVMPRKSAWQLLAESEKKQNKQQCPTKQAAMFYKTSRDFIISGAVIAMQLVRDCNNRKTSNALLFALVAQQRFIILAPSAKSGNGSRKGTKELCCSQLFSDSWRWDLLLNYAKMQCHHSPRFLLFTLLYHIFVFLPIGLDTQIITFYLQGSSVSVHLQ